MSIINREKIVFVSIDWMKYYKGITEDDMPVGTAGDNPIKHEQYTFLKEDGYCYGYIPPGGGNLNIREICGANEEIKKDRYGYEYIEHVLVVFTGNKGDGKGRRVVGFYCDATVYYEPCIKIKRKIKSNNTDVEESSVNYSVKANAQNVYLIPEAERTLELPYAKRDGYGYGRDHRWYASKKDGKRVVAFRNKTIKYIESIINNKRNKPVSEDTIIIDESIRDEKKYYEGRITQYTKETTLIARNPEARKKCLDFYFKNKGHYKCQICGFDFEETYGDIGKQIIDVHHIESHAQVAKKRGEHKINPEKDLIPICSNCHNIIHRKEPPLKIDEIKNLINVANKRRSKLHPK
jgi:5-methylcytosine-specific restriction enzyme A